MNLLEFSKENPPAVGTADGKGTPFDGGRHLPRVHAKTLRWLPRSPGRGNKGQTRLQGVDSTAQRSAQPAPIDAPRPPDLPPVQEVSAEEILQLPPAAAPSKASDATPGPAQGPASAPAPGPLPEVKPAADTGAAAEPGSSSSSPEPAPARGDTTMAHDAAAELTTRVVYTLTGVAIKDHKRATATGEEHKNIRAAVSAFYAHRGVVFVGSVALALVFVAYALGDARREEVINTIKRVFARKPKAGPGASGPVVDVETAPPPPPPPPAPAPSAFSDFAR
jgi:hypothetical protein